jgi:hypothetical protein
MWQWLKQWFLGKAPITNSPRDELRLSEDGVYYVSRLSRARKWPELWPWESVREFGLSFDQAIYPDPWFGDYMEAEWFFTVENSEGPQRFFVDVDYFSIDTLPIVLSEKLPNFDRAMLVEGWRQYRIGERNFKGAGQWLAWKKIGFEWPIHELSDSKKLIV